MIQEVSFPSVSWLLLDLLAWATKSGNSSTATGHQQSDDPAQKRALGASDRIAQPSHKSCQSRAADHAEENALASPSADQDSMGIAAETVSNAQSLDKSFQSDRCACSKSQVSQRTFNKSGRRTIRTEHMHIVRPGMAALQRSVSCPEAAEQPQFLPLRQPRDSCGVAAPLRSHSLCLEDAAADCPEFFLDCSKDAESGEHTTTPFASVAQHPVEASPKQQQHQQKGSESPNLDRLQSHSLCLASSEIGSSLGSFADLASLNDSLPEPNLAIPPRETVHDRFVTEESGSNGSAADGARDDSAAESPVLSSCPSGSESSFEDALEAQASSVPTRVCIYLSCI
jgi:hypothetical protein